MLQGCTYAQKTSDLFLKHIQRSDPSSQQQQCVHHVQTLRVRREKVTIERRESIIAEYCERTASKDTGGMG